MSCKISANAEGRVFDSKILMHNPHDRKSLLHEYLVKSANLDDGVFHEKHVQVKSYDLETERLQKGDVLVVLRERTWVTTPKAILK